MPGQGGNFAQFALEPSCYLDLKTDIQGAGSNTNLVTFKIGSRGQIKSRNKNSCYKNNLKMKHHERNVKNITPPSLI